MNKIAAVKKKTIHQMGRGREARRQDSLLWRPDTNRIHLTLMKATVYFSTVSDNTLTASASLEGVASLNHANIIGHGLVGDLSIARGVSLYLARTETEADGFTLHPKPGYFQQGVTITILD